MLLLIRAEPDVVGTLEGEGPTADRNLLDSRNICAVLKLFALDGANVVQVDLHVARHRHWDVEVLVDVVASGPVRWLQQNQQVIGGSFAYKYLPYS